MATQIALCEAESARICSIPVQLSCYTPKSARCVREMSLLADGQAADGLARAFAAKASNADEVGTHLVGRPSVESGGEPPRPRLLAFARYAIHLVTKFGGWLLANRNAP